MSSKNTYLTEDVQQVSFDLLQNMVQRSRNTPHPTIDEQAIVTQSLTLLLKATKCEEKDRLYARHLRKEIDQKFWRVALADLSQAIDHLSSNPANKPEELVSAPVLTAEDLKMGELKRAPLDRIGDFRARLAELPKPTRSLKLAQSKPMEILNVASNPRPPENLRDALENTAPCPGKLTEAPIQPPQLKQSYFNQQAPGLAPAPQPITPPPTNVPSFENLKGIEKIKQQALARAQAAAAGVPNQPRPAPSPWADAPPQSRDSLKVLRPTPPPAQPRQPLAPPPVYSDFPQDHDTSDQDEQQANMGFMTAREKFIVEQKNNKNKAGSGSEAQGGYGNEGRAFHKQRGVEDLAHHAVFGRGLKVPERDRPYESDYAAGQTTNASSASGQQQPQARKKFVPPLLKKFEVCYDSLKAY
jgi:hypothetical protein